MPLLEPYGIRTRVALASAMCVTFMPIAFRIGPLTTMNGALPLSGRGHVVQPVPRIAQRADDGEHDRHVSTYDNVPQCEL